MVSVVADMEPDKPFPYIDDILISAGKTFGEHLTILAETLVRLGNTGFQVNVDKSEFFSKVLKFLGLFYSQRDISQRQCASSNPSHFGSHENQRRATFSWSL
jgi:hypothetical protein